MHKKIGVFILFVALLFSFGFEVTNAANLVANPGLMENMPEIYILEDGSIDPNTAPIARNAKTYSLTGDITEYKLIIKCDNIVLDGKYHTLLGRGHGPIQDTAIDLSSSKNVEVRNFNIDNFVHGIVADKISDCTITGNSIKNTVSGINIGYSATNNKIAYNSIIGLDSGNGIRVFGSYNDVIGNDISNVCCGIEFNYGDHNAAINNTLLDITDEYIDISGAPDTVLENNILPVASPTPSPTTTPSVPVSSPAGSDFWLNPILLILGVVVVVLVFSVLLIARKRHKEKS